MTAAEKLAVASLVLGLASVGLFMYAVWEGEPRLRAAVKRWFVIHFNR